jgi:hypothetical protein
MQPANQPESDHESQKDKNVFSWQKKLLPWMVSLPTLLIIIFVYLATTQLNTFSNEINNYKSSELDKVFLRDSTLTIPTEINKGEFIKLYILAKMDEQLINKRYSQAGSLLISRLYTKYLGFFTGMILAIVGAVFIISKLSERVTKLETSTEAFKVSLVSASPGIIFGILGTSLMLATILKQNNIETTDTATFLNGGMYQIQNASPPEKKTDNAIDSIMKHSSPYHK